MLVAHRLGHQYHTLEEQEKDASENTELLPTVIVGAAFMLLRWRGRNTGSSSAKFGPHATEKRIRQSNLSRTVPKSILFLEI
jgi:hypothetical protein